MPEGWLGRLVGRLRGGVETQRGFVTERGQKMGTSGGRWGPKGVIVQKRFVFSNIFCLFKAYKGLSRVCNLKTSVCNIIIIM